MKIPYLLLSAIGLSLPALFFLAPHHSGTGSTPGVDVVPAHSQRQRLAFHCQ
jgi:hypothetical protein